MTDEPTQSNGFDWGATYAGPEYTSLIANMFFGNADDSLSATLGHQGPLGQIAANALSHNVDAEHRGKAEDLWHRLLNLINFAFDWVMQFIAPDTRAAEHGMLAQVTRAAPQFDQIEHATHMQGLSAEIQQLARHETTRFCGLDIPNDPREALHSAIRLHVAIANNVSVRFRTAHAADYNDAQQLQTDADAYGQSIASIVTGLSGTIDNSDAALDIALAHRPTTGYGAMLLGTQAEVNLQGRVRASYHDTAPETAADQNAADPFFSRAIEAAQIAAAGGTQLDAGDQGHRPAPSPTPRRVATLNNAPAA